MKSTRSTGYVCASVMTACTALLPMTGEVRAQTVFTTIQAFGDSYADNGNVFRIAGIPNPPQYPTGRFSGGTNFIDTTSALLGIPQANFAIGGATSGATNVSSPFLPGFTQEWQGFIASGRSFAPSDLLEMSVGGNDARAYRLAGGTLAGVPAAATVSFNQTMAGINALVGVGAKTIVFTTGDVGQLPEAIGNPNAAIGSAYSQNYNAQMQVALAAIARSGVRVELVDISLIGSLIKANPARYGVANVGACPLACIGNPALQNQYLFYFDGVHLTSLGFTIVGEYIVNRLNAPLTFAPQGDVALTSAMGFASTLYGKLDMFRETYGFMPSTMNAYAAYTKAPYLKAPPAPPVNPWSFYMLGNGGISDRQATVAANGFNLESVGGTIGTEYRINRNAFVGAAFDYSNPKARLLNNAGTTDVNSYQLGIYAAWADAHFFAQGLATYGWQNFRNTRPGVVDTITSNPDGTTFVAGGKAGYLFDAARTQIGPIGGLTYARVRVNGYTETGDPVLTLTVGQQTAEALVGSVGLQFRAPFLVNGRIISPYLNLTAEDDLIGNGRIIQYGATSAPLIINNWAIPNGSSQRIYGRVAGGVVAPVTDNVALTMNVARTVGHWGGDDFYGSGGLRISF
jgi:outer membrane lipase/esterase